MLKLVVFTMDRCPHCVQLKNHLKEVELEYTGLSIDTPEGEKKAKEWGVTNFPTLFFLNEDNVIVNAQVGFNTKSQDMREVIAEYEELTNG